MRKSTFIFALLILLMASCSKMERNEKKFVKAMQSDDYETSVNGFKDFCDWMLKDKNTMNYDFKLMKETYDMKAISSKDGKLRCYSWVTDNNPDGKIYANLIQWYAGERFVAFCGPLDFLLSGRKANIKKQATHNHSIDTIFDITSANKPVYIIAQSYVQRDGRRRAYVSAASVNGVQLMVLPFFFDGVEIAGNNEFLDRGNTPIGELFKWDEKAKKFYAYQTDDQYNLIPGKYTVYELGENRFTRLPEE